MTLQPREYICSDCGNTIPEDMDMWDTSKDQDKSEFTCEPCYMRQGCELMEAQVTKIETEVEMHRLGEE